MNGARTRKAKALTLQDAFETEFARRALERRQREEAERRQQALDLANAEALFTAVTAHPEFLAARELIPDRRRYTVSLDHPAFRISAYFEGGKASVGLSDKRSGPAAASLRPQEIAESVEDALNLIAQFLADEIR